MNRDRKIIQLPSLKQLESEAAEWIVRLDDGGMTNEDLAGLSRWLNQSEQHRLAYKRLKEGWVAFDQLEQLNDYAASSDYVTAVRSKQGILGRRRFLGLAATLLLAAGIGTVYISPFNSYPNVYKTSIGERKNVQLEDGTIIELNTDTKAEIAYSREARDIRLIKGEAYFEVAHDPSRPLSVFAGKGVVTALGTAFTIRMNREKLDVVVAEGRVSLGVLDKITPRSSSSLSEVSSGQDAVLSLSKDVVQRVDNLNLEQLNRKLAWRNGILSFSGDPLSAVIDDMSRYTQVKIEIADDDLKKLPVDGYFRIGEIDTMLEALELMANLKAEYVSENRIRLSKIPRS